MVVGAGIAGIQASLDLAEMGFHVDLIEQTPTIGGRMAQLDKTLPTNDCSICILAPKLSECSRHPNITIHSLSQVQEVKKVEIGFDVSIEKKARFVNEDTCINCGECVLKCPKKVPDEFDMYMRKRKAIYIYYLQGIPAIMAIDKEQCLHLTGLEKGKDICRLCQKVCPKDSIDFTHQDTSLDLKCGAIILATGSNQYDPSPLAQYGYGKYKNVITGLEYERMISASGPTTGRIQRLSDGKHPKKLAFIQCVGSRDVKTNLYCSSICCTYATKHAILAREHDDTIQSSIFYIDLRAGGKGFRKYINRAKNEYDVKYIRGMVSEIKTDSEENLILTYEDLETFEIRTQTVELVILASAMIPTYNYESTAKTIGYKLNKYNFVKVDEISPVSTDIPGIFACGSCLGPTDIPHSVVEASGAAGKAAEFIAKTQT
jgi:heterodisulfide reductase subunit A